MLEVIFDLFQTLVPNLATENQSELNNYLHGVVNDGLLIIEPEKSIVRLRMDTILFKSCNFFCGSISNAKKS